MSDGPKIPGIPGDPFKLWRQIYDASESAWSAALEKAMGSSTFAEANGKLMETVLTAQRTARESMRTALETVNVPTREDIARLGELIVGMEEKLDQVIDRLDALEERLARRPPPESASAPPSSRDEG